MKLRLELEDDAGRVYRGEAMLVADSPDTAERAKRSTGRGQARNTESVELSQLSLPIRPFVKRYVAGKSGPKVFTLLVAHAAKGGQELVERADVESQWNKMRGLIGGGFQPVYATRAKNEGWVDSDKSGVYKLLPDWVQLLNQ